VSSITEIEAAIERLPRQQVEELTRWLLQRQTGGVTRAGSGNLDQLAGSWVEDPAFDSAIQAFEQVDEALWR
jgi:hypothetical protein